MPYTVISASAASGSATFTTSAITGSANVGDVVAAVVGNSAGDTVSSFTDSKSNSYLGQIQLLTGNQVLGIWTSQITSPLVSGTDTFTANFSATGGAKFIIARGCAGLMTAVTDKNATNHATTGTTASSGATSVLAQPYEWVVGGIMDAAAGGTPSGLSFGTGLTNTNGSICTEFDTIVTTNAAITASGTIVSAAWGAVIATFPLMPPARGTNVRQAVQRACLY